MRVNSKVQTLIVISQQFPRGILEKRLELVPIMKAAHDNGKEAYIVVDKLYIDKTLYREQLL